MDDIFSLFKQQHDAEEEARKDDPFSQFKKQMEISASGTLYSTAGVNPDQYATAKKVAGAIGMPTSLVQDDMNTYQEMALHQKNASLLKTSPEVTAFITPQNAPLVKDDIENLSAFAKIWRGFDEGVKNALEDREESFSYFEDMMTGNRPRDFKGDQEEAETDSWLYKGSRLAGNIFTQLGASATSGGLKGAVVGSVVPVLGTGIGFAAGLTTDQALQSAGSTYKETYDSLTSNGVDEEKAKWLAMQASSKIFSTSFALGVLPVTRAVSMFGATVRNEVTNLGRAVVSGTVEEAVEEMATEAANVYFIESAKQEAGVENVFDNPNADKLSAIASRVGQAGFLGGLAGGMLSGSFYSTGAILKRMGKVTHDPLQTEVYFTEAFKTAKKSKTFVRDPDTFKDFTDIVVNKTGANTVYLPVNNVIPFVEKNPDTWRRAVPDIDAQIEEANQTGQDIAVNTSNFIIYLQDDAETFIPDLKTQPDGMSANEARTLASELPTAIENDYNEFMQSITGDTGKPEDKFKMQVFNDVIGQLEREGYGTPQDRMSVAMLATQRYIGRAMQNNNDYGNAFEEYKRNPFIINFVDENTQEPYVDQPIARERVNPTDNQIVGTKLGEGQIKISGEYHPTDIMIVEADTLFPELDGQSDTQFKDRSRADAESQIQKYVSQPDPNYLTPHFPDQIQGSPTLTPDNRITGGNVRSEVIKRLYSKGNATTYRAMVEAEAQKAGIDISGFKKPAIVRVLASGVSAKEAAISSNEGAYSAQSTTEQANVDAERLTNIKEFGFTEQGRLAKVGNEGAIQKFLGQYPIEEQSAFRDKSGKLSLGGENRILSAILVKAFGADPIIYKILESGGEFKNIQGALLAVAPQVAKVEAGIMDGDLHAVSIKQDLLDAINKLIYLRQQDMTVDAFLAQVDTIDDFTPESKVLLKFLDDNLGKPRVLREKIKQVFDRIEEMGSPKQESLIPIDLPTKADALKDLNNMEEYQQSGRGRILISDNMNFIQLYRDADASTLIHEFGHKWLDELFIDAKAGQGTERTSLLVDYDVTKNWFKTISPDILTHHTENKRGKVDKQARKKDRAMLKAIKDRGGQDYINKMVDEDFPIMDDVDQYTKMMFHEAWARGFETYIMEGKAPTRSLREPFQHLSRAMTNVYKGVTSLGVPVNDDIRGVFDRMLGAEATMMQVVDGFGLNSLFLNYEQSGMSKEMFLAYNKKMQAQLNRMREKLTAQRMKKYREERSNRGKAQLAEIEAKYENQSKNSRPIKSYNRIMGLDGGETMLIDLDSFKKQFDQKPAEGQTEDSVEQLTRKVPKELFTKSGQEGVHYEIAAELLGYQSGMEFINDMMNLEAMRVNAGRTIVKKGDKTTTRVATIDEARQKHIKKLAKQEYQQIQEVEDYTERAEEAFQRSRVDEILVDELNGLSSIITNKLKIDTFQPENVGTLRMHAREQFYKSPYATLIKQHKKYRLAAEVASTKAHRLLVQGDYEGAYKAKKEHIIAYLMYKEASQFVKDFRKTQQLIDKISKNPAIKGSSSQKGVHADHMQLLHAILNWAGIKTSRTQKPSRVGKDVPPFKPIMEEIQDFMANDEIGDRKSIYIPDVIKANKTEGLTVDEFMDVALAIQSIYTHGQDTWYELGLNSAIEYNERIENMALTLTRGKPQTGERAYLSSKSKDKWDELGDNIKSWFDLTAASMRRAESFANEFDHYNSSGVWNTTLIEPMQIGKRGHFQFMRGFNTILDAKKERMGTKEFHAWQSSLDERIPNSSLYDYRMQVVNGQKVGMPTLLELRKIDIISMAFHLGSPENFQKLIKGREFADGLDANGQKIPTGWTADAINTLVHDNMTQEDWDLVTSFAKHVGTQWQQKQAVIKRLKGVAPPEVITTPVPTKFGTLDGWYWPLIYEETITNVKSEDSSIVGAIFDGDMNADFSFARKDGVRRPMLISFDDMMNRIERDSYYTNMVEPVVNAAKMLSDRRIEDAITRAKSQQHYRALVDWVRDTANRNRRNMGMQDFLAPLGTRLQAGASINFFTYAVKPIADNMSEFILLPTHRDLGIKGMYRGLNWLVHNSFNNREEIYKFFSQFDDYTLRHGGADKLMADVKRAIPNKWGLTSRLYNRIVEIGYHVMMSMDSLKGAIAARGAYENFIEANPNATDAEIITHVNKVIREVSPSRDLIDQSLVQRDKLNGHLKFYMGFLNGAFNRVADDFILAKQKAESAKSAYGTAKGAFKFATGSLTPLFYAMVIGWFGQYLSGAFTGDDEEDKAGLAEQVIKGTVGGVASMFPVMSELYHVAVGSTPFAGQGLDLRYSAIKDVVKSTRKLVTGKEFNEDDFLNFFEAAGFIGQFPVKRPVAATRYLYGLSTGEIEAPDNIPEFIGDIQRGRQIDR
jgi:hypothetical protein